MNYKNILWIDDECDRDSTGSDDPLQNEADGVEDCSHDIDKIKGYFFEHCNNVKWIKDYKKALEALKNDNNQFDLIVFDINMEDGVGFIEEFNEIRTLLKERRVDVNEVELKKEEQNKLGEEFKAFKEKAGIYLYLFLLNCGYPNERMVFLTGNSTVDAVKFLKEAHIYTGLGEGSKEEMQFILEKEGETMPKKDEKWVDKLYEDEYYQIRRLVYKACEYWKEKLESVSKIAFNEIYFDKEPELEKESFINMMERIELLFPVIKPREPNALYYQAMQVVSMFHEESALITKLSKCEENRCYHQSIRNFRNWSAHNKFLRNNVDAKLFALIFCLSLRSYFDGDLEKKCKDQFKGIKEYEQEYFKCAIKVDINYENFKKKYTQEWKRHFEKLHEIGGKNKNCWECENINELLISSGLCKNEKGREMQFADTLLNILGDWILKIKELEVEDNEYTYTINYKWKNGYNQEMYKNELDKIFEESPLKYYAYIIFSVISN